jgi:hypothetical protein
MMNISHNSADHYWIVGGDGPHKRDVSANFTGDSSRVWSSKRDAYVRADDADYVRWRDMNMQRYGFDLTTRIDTELNLIEVLKNSKVPCSLAKTD